MEEVKGEGYSQLVKTPRRTFRFVVIVEGDTDIVTVSVQLACVSYMQQSCTDSSHYINRE